MRSNLRLYKMSIFFNSWRQKILEESNKWILPEVIIQKMFIQKPIESFTDRIMGIYKWVERNMYYQKADNAKNETCTFAVHSTCIRHAVTLPERNE